MTDIKQIAERVAKDLDGETAWADQAPLTKDLQLFAERFLAAWLKEAGEPVGKIVGHGVAWIRHPHQIQIDSKLFLAPPPAVPEGWQLVPKEVTPQMLMALIEVEEIEDPKQDLQNMWQAMLAAAPEPRKP